MLMFTNKHVIVAMLVAPILGVLAYFAADMAIGEKPQPAVAGQNYKLAAGPDCRYASGKCTLRNGDLTVQFHATKNDAGNWDFIADANLDLNTVAVVIVSANDTTSAPVNMRSIPLADEDDNGSKWSLEVPPFDKENDIMRVVVFAGQSLYIVETKAIFPVFETRFTESGS